MVSINRILIITSQLTVFKTKKLSGLFVFFEYKNLSSIFSLMLSSLSPLVAITESFQDTLSIFPIKVRKQLYSNIILTDTFSLSFLLDTAYLQQLSMCTGNHPVSILLRCLKCFFLLKCRQNLNVKFSK